MKITVVVNVGRKPSIRYILRKMLFEDGHFRMETGNMKIINHFYFEIKTKYGLKLGLKQYDRSIDPKKINFFGAKFLFLLYSRFSQNRVCS